MNTLQQVFTQYPNIPYSEVFQAACSLHIKTVYACNHCGTIVKQKEQKNGCPYCGFLKFSKKII